MGRKKSYYCPISWLVTQPVWKGGRVSQDTLDLIIHQNFYIYKIYEREIKMEKECLQ